MAIYRGLGGAGSNEQDASITVITQKALEVSANTASANTSKNEAAASAVAAANSATASASSASAALVSENNASSSATISNISAGSAQDAEAAAAASQTATAASALSAFNSAAAAAISETNAAASAALALGVYGDAASQAASVAAAAASSSAAGLSESNAASSASAALASQNAATTSETNASNSALAASTSETNAAASEAAAAASFDSFDDRYLGSKTSDPLVDNDGNALLTGALYFDSAAGVMKVWNGTNWVAAYASLSGAMFGSNNLSDVSSISSARSNLGLGTAAVEDVSAFIAPNSTATLYSLTTTDGLEVGGALVVTGNLTVNGTTTTIDTTNLAIEDNMIYLNSGSAVTNPDLGIAGNYNDGSYAHAGFFRDATDGRWKPFDGYTPEPDASPEIDTSHASFSLGDIQAGTFYGALVGNASTATLAATATNVAYSGLTGTVPTWNQNTTGNAATADYATSAGTAAAVPYANLTGTVPTWNQNTTGNAATATNPESGGSFITSSNIGSQSVSYATSAGSATTATSATSATTATTLSTGTWTVTESGGVLYFAVSGTNKAKLDSSGNLTVVGDVTAYGSV